MRVYHGTTTWKMQSLLSGDFSRWPGLFVTDTRERAARYANSQAQQEVTQQTFPLAPCAVVVAIEVKEQVKWLRRPESHSTLDICEAIIQRGRIVEMWIGQPGRLSFTEQKHVEEAQKQLQTIPMHIEGGN